MVEIVVEKSEDAFLEAAAHRVVRAADEAVAARGRFLWVLSGGRTPKQLFALLAQSNHRERLPWSKIRVFWGDERCVPPDHPDSNFLAAQEALLSHVPIPPDHIHRIPAEMGSAQDAANEYEKKLREIVGETAPPRFDLIMLGVGEDGHTASLFPGTPALDETKRWVVGQRVASLGVDRITLTFPVINAARHILFLCAGGTKASIVREIFQEGAADRYPAQRVRPSDGDVVWFLDAAAASQLPAATMSKAEKS